MTKLPPNLKLDYTPYFLEFKEPGGTSRGILHRKLTYFIRIRNLDRDGAAGYGEVPVFENLSKESPAEVESILHSISLGEDPETSRFPSSIVMGLETALQDLQHGEKDLFTSPFVLGEEAIEINGLIWMGDKEKMRERIDTKLKQNFKCIKIKIGGINWNDELDLLKYVRECGDENLILRVDANGAFSSDNCMSRLEALANLKVHSIEQPIKAGNWDEMRKICEISPVPVALDEELIGIPIGDQRSELLDYIKPHFLILKPALCFGFSGTADWIERAKLSGTGWWITSALESSVGLNAIAQFTGQYHPSIPQGLGTGNLFVNNFNSFLTLKGDNLTFNRSNTSFKNQLNSLWKGI